MKYQIHNEVAYTSTLVVVAGSLHGQALSGDWGAPMCRSVASCPACISSDTSQSQMSDRKTTQDDETRVCDIIITRQNSTSCVKLCHRDICPYTLHLGAVIICRCTFNAAASDEPQSSDNATPSLKRDPFSKAQRAMPLHLLNCQSQYTY